MAYQGEGFIHATDDPNDNVKQTKDQSRQAGECSGHPPLRPWTNVNHSLNSATLMDSMLRFAPPAFAPSAPMPLKHFLSLITINVFAVPLCYT